MSKKEHTGFNFSSVDLLVYMWNKRWILIIVSFLAAVTSIIVSLQITEKFKSSVVLFPTTGASVSKALLSANYTGRQSVYGFGEEEQAEQLLQVLNSEKIRETIIQKYNLMEHYEIDPESKYPYTQLANTYKSNISFRRTELMSVEISVLDTDPQVAADIANDISNLIDTVFNEMKQERAQAAFELVSIEFEEASENIRLLQDSLKQVGAEISTALRRLEGSSTAQMTTALAQYGGTFISLTKNVEHNTRRYTDLRQRYQEARMEANQKLPYKFIVDKAYPSEKKAYPKRSVIVMASTASAFLFTLILLIIIDSLQQRAVALKEE
jgi:uncharacterized protein involved in exopolysaccharide biosynthesis